MLRQCVCADLTKLPLLDGVVKETLRLHGTLPLGTARVTVSDMVIGGYRVPKGTPIMMSSYPLHASDNNYISPAQFWPERWSQQVDVDSALDKGRFLANDSIKHVVIVSLMRVCSQNHNNDNAATSSSEHDNNDDIDNNKLQAFQLIAYICDEWVY